MRRASSLALPCYVSSLHASSDIAIGLLPQRLQAAFADSVRREGRRFQALWPDVALTQEDFVSQSRLDELGWRSDLARLLALCVSPAERAAMLAAQHPLARGWLRCFPVPQVGTSLSDSTFRVGSCQRLGIRPCTFDICARCRSVPSTAGTHGLHCRRSAGRHSRHSSLNEEVKRAFCSAQVPARREPTGLNTNQLRPDGITTVPWSLGHCLAWDVTVVDTLAPSYVADSAHTAGSAATLAEERKRSKYNGQLPVDVDFVPLAFETLGGWGPSTASFLDELGKRLIAATGDKRAKDFLFQRLSVAILHGNAASVLGSVIDDDVEENNVYLDNIAY